MTGAPAETWRKFRLRRAPWWAFWVGGILLSAALSDRASGYLPLTRASAKTLWVVRWIFGSLVPIAIVLWVIGVFDNSPNLLNRAIFEFLFLLGFSALFGGFVGMLLGRRAVPQLKLLERHPGHYESMVELANVHPAFVAAVQQLQLARATQYAPN